MDIWEQDKLILFLLFVIPGFISIKSYEIFIPTIRKDSSNQIIDAIAYSCLNYGVSFPLIIYVENTSLKTDYFICYYLFYLVVFVILPITWALIWKKLRETKKFQKLAPHPIQKPWDYVFSKKEKYFIKIVLTNGTIVGGYYGENSFTSSSPSPEQIYLEQSWVIKDDGSRFERAKNDTQGILIMETQISYIEFKKLQQGES